MNCAAMNGAAMNGAALEGAAMNCAAMNGAAALNCPQFAGRSLRLTLLNAAAGPNTFRPAPPQPLRSFR
ncbi:MAG: hypothetical protein AAF411_07515 [Myxococcota bacterium]